jgi:hypothetical protein
VTTNPTPDALTEDHHYYELDPDATRNSPLKPTGSPTPLAGITQTHRHAGETCWPAAAIGTHGQSRESFNSSGHYVAASALFVGIVSVIAVHAVEFTGRPPGAGRRLARQQLGWGGT